MEKTLQEKTLYWVLAVAYATALTGCSEGTDRDDVDAVPIIVDHALYLAYIDLAQADFSIDAGEINRDILKLTVSYPDGCQDYDFKLIASTLILYTSPPGAVLGLFREEEQNSCIKNTTINLYFDLTPLQQITDGAPIRIPLAGLEAPLYYHFQPQSIGGVRSRQL